MTASTLLNYFNLSYQKESLYQLISKNLEWMLNTRMEFNKIDLILHSELEKSLLNYGISDFMHAYYGSKNNQKKLCQEIAKKIQLFEPRIKNAKVNIIFEQEQNDTRILRLTIEVELHESVSEKFMLFESNFDVLDQQFRFIE